MMHVTQPQLRRLAVWAALVVIGAVIGVSLVPTRNRSTLAYCTIDEASVDGAVRRCPPDTNRSVLATWEPGVTVAARYEWGTWWLSERVLGRATTTYPPNDWKELP